MEKKLLTFLIYICLYTTYVSALENNTSPVVVFDFGGVIAQANTTQMVNFLIDTFNINKDELSVLLSYEIGVKKPNPEAFQILLKKLKKPASSVLFIDDRIENVEAAKIQGIDAIHFINPKQLKKELERRGFDLGSPFLSLL